MRSARFILQLLLIAVAALVHADSGTVQLTTLPTITVADARSTVTVSAYVRRPSGQPVPDGTQVVFTTTLGSFKDDSVVQTVNGVARVVLQTGSTPGTAKITAAVYSVGAVTTAELEFLSDRSLLSSANEYVEVVAPGYMAFSMDQKILGAAGVSHGAKLRYREIEIEADDLQLNIPAYEVRAKKAHLKMGKVNQDFDELLIRLSQRKGIGTTTITPSSPLTATIVERVPWFMPTHAYYGIASIRSSGFGPSSDALNPNDFKFADLSDSTSMVSAKKAVVFPHKLVQFHKAEVRVGGVKLLSMPLYEVSLNSASTVVTDQIFSITNNQPTINYPHYLILKPGITSLLRFTTGQQYGRSSGVDKGLNLNYELNWNRGDEFDGGLVLSGMTSRSWNLNAHQYIRFDDRTSGTAFLEMPEGRSIFGSLNFNKQFSGFGMNLNGNSTHNLRGSKFDSQQFTFVAEKDPIRIGKLPLRFSYGLNASANDTTTSLQTRSQETLGVHFRTQLMPLKLDRSTQLMGYFTVGEQTGHNSVQGLALQGSATLSRQIGKYASGLLSYEYLQNGFSSGLMGRQQLSFAGNYHQGNFASTISAAKSLDVDKISFYGDFGYQLGNQWRLAYSYTLDRYIGNTYVDYTAAIGYRIGFREVGLTYSGRTKRFGIQLLGAGLGN